MEQVVWSHSRLNKLLENPAEYFLIYEEGIKPKQEKAALSAGSAVHWALEHNTSDLTEYYQEKGKLLEYNDYTDEACLVECMAEAYFRNKVAIYREMLHDYEDNKDLAILDEYHELNLTCEFPSKLFTTPHKFLGIIDLLLLTDKGWILIDYKTSSRDVDWDEYKSQLYKYIQMLRYNFPEIPLWKMAIINLKKTSIRRKKNENDDSFRDRIRMEYDLNEENYIKLHVYDRTEFSEEQLAQNLSSLSEMMDLGQMILNNKLFFTHYSNIVNQFGPSQYYDIFYKTPDNYNLYTIRDLIFDEDENNVVNVRDCRPIDMQVLDSKNDILINKFSRFKEQVEQLKKKGITDDDDILEALRKQFITDENLLQKYMKTYNLCF